MHLKLQKKYKNKPLVYYVVCICIFKLTIILVFKLIVVSQ